jgi:hypothetical protein
VFTYAQAETILGKLYGVPDQATQRGAFRGRLKHLLRLGIPLGSRPGKGVRVAYGAEHLYQWAFCLELEEVGLDPTVIVRMLKAQWPKIRAGFKKTAKDSRELFMVLMPLGLMSASWWKQADEVPFVAALPLDEAYRYMDGLAQAIERSRWLVFNLSRITRAVEAASKEAT